MMIIWLLLAAVCLIIEAATVELVSIWSCAGAFCAAVAAALTAPLWVQCVVFTTVTLISLLLLRTFCQKRINVNRTMTNIDSLVGKKAVVVETVHNLQETGTVRLNGLVWAAKSSDENRVIEKGTTIRVLSVEGVKLVVEPVDE